jgi:hypothetical protein
MASGGVKGGRAVGESGDQKKMNFDWPVDQWGSRATLWHQTDFEFDKSWNVQSRVG